jgi:HEAT repeat protein
MQQKKLQTNVRTLIVLVAACGAMAWAYHHVNESNRVLTTADWVNRIDSWSVDERKSAVQKLLEAPASESEVVIPGLIRALNDTNASIRLDAALALAHCVAQSTRGDQSALQNHARRVASSLLEVLEHDKDAGVRAAAASALSWIRREVVKAKLPADPSTPSDPLSPDVIVKAFAEEIKREPASRPSMLAAFEQLGPMPMSAPPSIVEALDDPSTVNRGHALKALTLYSSGVDRAVPVLLKDLETNNDRFPPEYLGFARAMRPSPAVVPILIKALESDNGLVREASAALLARIDPAPRAAAPALIAAVRKANAIGDRPGADSGAGGGGGPGGGALAASSSNRPPPPPPGSVSTDLLRALAKAAPPEDAVPLLIEVLKRKSADARSAAAVGLAEIGPASQAAIPALLATLREANAAQGRSATGYGTATARALGRIGPEAAPSQASADDVIAALSQTLNVNSDQFGAAAAEALGNFGPRAAAAVPQLRKLLNARFTQAKDNAKAAIEKIEGPSKPTKDTEPR